MDMTEFRALVRSAVETVEFEGLPLRLCRGEVPAPGDTVLAGRNTGPHLLTIRDVYDDCGPAYATYYEKAYPFDLRECIKVEVSV